MIKGIIKWVKKQFTETNEVHALGRVITRKARPKPQPPQRNPNNWVYLNDPSTPSLIAEFPEPRDTLLPMRAMGEQGGGFPLGTIQQQSLAIKQMVNDSLVYMASKSPQAITQWATVGSLLLNARAGKNLNAYYDRGGLKFFYFGDPVKKKNVFAADARPVVTHEFGHALLDLLRPDWWSVQATEIWAFHEAFGDITWLLTALQMDALIDHAIAETSGDIAKSNIITRMAAEMGTGLYNITHGSEGELPNCLRDCTQKFDYVEPESLPKNGRDDHLLNESHSFSRVFSSAFYEIIVRIVKQNSSMPAKDAMKHAGDTMAKYLLGAVVSAPTTVRLFDAIARQMLRIDESMGGTYQIIIQDVFSSKNILRPQLSALADVELSTFVNAMKEPHEIQTFGDTKIIRTLSTKTFRMADQFEVSALDDNPLYNLEISVPNQTAHYFNENDRLVGVVESSNDEIVEAAYHCLKILNDENLVGQHHEALFEEKYGKLIRKQIVCKCGKPNYCDPNAPEYGKAWKPKNNSGCVKCGQGDCLPRSCDCTEPEVTPPPKIGCYTTTKVGGRTTYKYGSRASRKVC